MALWEIISIGLLYIAFVSYAYIACKKLKSPFTKKLGQTNNAKIIAKILGFRRSALSLDIYEP